MNSAHADTLGVGRLIGQPQVGVHMLDETHGVSVLDVREAHPIDFLLHTRVQLLLGSRKEKK